MFSSLKFSKFEYVEGEGKFKNKSYQGIINKKLVSEKGKDVTSIGAGAAPCATLQARTLINASIIHDNVHSHYIYRPN